MTPSQQSLLTTFTTVNPSGSFPLTPTMVGNLPISLNIHAWNGPLTAQVYSHARHTHLTLTAPPRCGGVSVDCAGGFDSDWRNR